MPEVTNTVTFGNTEAKRAGRPRRGLVPLLGHLCMHAAVAMCPQVCRGARRSADGWQGGRNLYAWHQKPRSLDIRGQVRLSIVLQDDIGLYHPGSSTCVTGIPVFMR